MAEKRMFARKIVESARFLKMPLSSQNLYFHLGMYADDDGIVEAYLVLNLTNSNEDDLRILFGKGFVEILNDDLVSYIVHWRDNNSLRADRKVDSIYQKLLLDMKPEVKLLERKTRSDVKKIKKYQIDEAGVSMDRPWTEEYSVVENSIGKYSIEQCVAELGKERLMLNDYISLTEKYSQTIVDEVISRIITHPYINCLNVKKIDKWCNENLARKKVTDKHTKMDNQKMIHREYDFVALEEEMLNEKI